MKKTEQKFFFQKGVLPEKVAGYFRASVSWGGERR
jgi:hypothetical protein